MLTYEELRKALPIDPNGLDGDCALHAELLMEAGELLAEAKSISEAAKHNLDVTKAEIALKYRTGELKGEAKTETAIASLVVLHPDVQKKEAEVIVAQKYTAKCASLANAFEHRRSMLGNETDLYVSKYYHGADVKPSWQHQQGREELELEIIQKRKQHESRTTSPGRSPNSRTAG